MLEGKYEKNRVSKDVELTPQRNRSEQEQKQKNEKELREIKNQRKNDEKKER